MKKEEKLPLDLRFTMYIVSIFIALFFYRSLTDWIIPLAERMQEVSLLLENPSYKLYSTWFLTIIFTIISVELLKKYVFFKERPDEERI